MGIQWVLPPILLVALADTKVIVLRYRLCVINMKKCLVGRFIIIKERKKNCFTQCKTILFLIVIVDRTHSSVLFPCIHREYLLRQYQLKDYSNRMPCCIHKCDRHRNYPACKNADSCNP